MLETETRTAASSERAQLIEALIEVAAERGYMDTSIEMVIARALMAKPHGSLRMAPARITRS